MASSNTGQNVQQDRDGLVGKLDEAVSKLAETKPLDVARKLRDFEAKVVQLADAGKIDLADAAALLAAADAILDCLDPTGVTATLA